MAAAGGLGAVVLLVAILFATAAGGSSGGYTVRAIFDDAANVIGGEDVKVDGVKVGTVGSVTPTPTGKAAVTLDIANPGFQDFRDDATCTIKPQALIGEKYVDCLPTQPRAEGTPLPPPLARIPAHREGAGEWLLPVQRTSSPVGVDQLSDINHLPENQRLAIIINELGAGLAGRGSDLNAVLHRSNPALREFEKVLGILASENKLLGNLAVESAQALAPITRDRRQFAEFFAQSNTVSTASARHRGAIAESLASFPAFLRQLGPALKRLEAFSAQTIPVFQDLAVAAPGVNRTFESLPGFSNSSTQFFKSLGRASKGIESGLVATQPLLNRFETLGKAATPFASNFSQLLTSVRSTGGLERLLDLIFLGANNANGYNALGHFIRANGVGALCAFYKTIPVRECNANFINLAASTAQASSTASGTTLAAARVAAIAHGATASQALAEYPGSETAAAPLGAVSPTSGSAKAQPVGGASAGTTYYTPGGESSEASGMLLNYLLGE
ncbi:MAG TPA: MlaD family protein [Solirubrobacteraceae bacterium]|jgi:phospholipid/cholesterol/gamma-HCH transport system substrate-binding protein|nr:MlaD family protein [Solirubrobacteraceae bacterium]